MGIYYVASAEDRFSADESGDSIMTPSNLDAERPHETVPCNCPTDGECANECTACQRAADNAWDCDHQGAAVHHPSDFEGHNPPLRIWVSKEYATNPDHHMRLLGDDVEVVSIAPIQAALEACEREALHPDGRISFRRSDYDALVVAIK